MANATPQALGKQRDHLSRFVREAGEQKERARRRSFRASMASVEEEEQEQEREQKQEKKQETKQVRLSGVPAILLFALCLDNCTFFLSGRPSTVRLLENK